MNCLTATEKDAAQIKFFIPAAQDAAQAEELERRVLLWVGDDRTEETVRPFFTQEMGKRRCQTLRVVCMDMWAPYRIADIVVGGLQETATCPCYLTRATARRTKGYDVDLIGFVRPMSGAGADWICYSRIARPVGLAPEGFGSLYEFCHSPHASSRRMNFRS